jgi:hypothetical protein
MKVDGRVLVLFLSALLCDEAFAQSLEERVRELERRLEQLEKQIEQRPRKTTPSRDGWRHKENWRSLGIGMTENDVRSILGEPHNINVTPTLIFWYYKNPGGGSVLFGGDRRVVSWTEPVT